MVGRGFEAAVAFAFLASASTAQEWSIRADQLGSTMRADRDVDISVVTLSAPTRSLSLGEIGFQGGFFASQGQTTENGGLTYQSGDANAVFVGGYARFSPAQADTTVQPFVEIGMAAVVTDRNLPGPVQPGDPRARFYGKFDARLGAEVFLSAGLALEGSAVLTHISNATGIGAQNLNFDGAGLSLGLTRRW